MDGAWEYHAKQNKSDEKWQKSYNFTCVGYTYKTKSNKSMNKQTHRHRWQYGDYERESGVGEENRVKGG